MEKLDQSEAVISVAVKFEIFWEFCPKIPTAVSSRSFFTGGPGKRFFKNGKKEADPFFLQAEHDGKITGGHDVTKNYRQTKEERPEFCVFKKLKKRERPQEEITGEFYLSE